MRMTTVIAVALGVLLATTMYVHATTNALYESYQVGIDSFKRPFAVVHSALFLFSLAGVFALVAIPRLRARFPSQVAALGIAAMCAAVLVLSMGSAPCLRPHPTTEPHHTHHTLDQVVERSLLCPRYSIRSYQPPIFWLFLGGFAVASVRFRRHAA